MSRSTLVGLVTAISIILFITLGLGQACSSDFSSTLNGTKVPGTSIFVGVGSNGNGGGYSGMDSNGNGGGYSGLQSISQGPYDDRTDARQRRRSSHYHSAYRSWTSYLSAADEVYLHVEAQSGCRGYMTGWSMAGPNVGGILAIQTDDEGDMNSASYLSSACLMPLATGTDIPLSEMTVLDFNPSVAIYKNDIYQLAASSPPDISTLQTITAYCRSEITQSPAGADLGLDVKIYRRGQQLLGVINFGKPNSTGDGATRYAVPPFTVDEATSRDQVIYRTNGFELSVTTSDPLPSVGSMMVNLDGQQIALAMKCWH